MFDEIIIGINLKRLISIPHHINNQFDLDTIIIVLITSVDEIRRINERLRIFIKI